MNICPPPIIDFPAPLRVTNINSLLINAYTLRKCQLAACNRKFHQQNFGVHIQILAGRLKRSCENEITGILPRIEKPCESRAPLQDGTEVNLSRLHRTLHVIIINDSGKLYMKEPYLILVCSDNQFVQ